MSEMNPDLSPVIPPDVLDPQAYRLDTGSPEDDDGLAIDDYFRAPDHLPVKSERLVVSQESTRPATRLVYNRLNMTTPLNAAMLFPADVNRLTVYMVSCLGSPFWYSDQPFTIAPGGDVVQTGMVHAIFSPGLSGAIIELAGHTGAVYVCGTADETTVIQGSAVTR